MIIILIKVKSNKIPLWFSFHSDEETSHWAFLCLSLSAIACVVQQCWLVQLSTDTKKQLKRYPPQLMNLFEQLSHSFGFTVTVFTLVALIKFWWFVPFKARTIMYMASLFRYHLLGHYSLLMWNKLNNCGKSTMQITNNCADGQGRDGQWYKLR